MDGLRRAKETAPCGDTGRVMIQGGENSMTSQQVLETLEKQLQLLSERSKDCSVDEQVKLTEAMVEISQVLLTP